MQTDTVQPSGGLRVLVVDNEPAIREQHAKLLTQWGHIPYVAEGQGVELLDDAKHKARLYRCQIALVDMRLIDDTDRRDRSGLELVPELAPARAIIVSAFGDRQAAVAALKHYGAEDFVGKDDDLLKLRDAIDSLARAIPTGAYRAEVIWEHLSSAAVNQLLFPGQDDIPADEADDLIGRVFPEARRVVLRMLGDDGEAIISAPLQALEPSDSSPLSASGGDHLSTLRRSSRVFIAQVDEQPAVCVVKIAHREKIQNEVANFKRDVETGLRGIFRAEIIKHELLWDMGAAVFRYIGGAHEGQGMLLTFTRSFRLADDAAKLLPPLQHFFEVANWGYWYRKAEQLDRSLFDAYDTMWDGALGKARGWWRRHDPTFLFPGLSVRLPNPMRWLYEHADRSAEVQGARQAVTHGDLHGNNLFVNTHHAWPIDFERTRKGPILRDFVELIQDVTTRIPLFEKNGLSEVEALQVLYELAVVICRPHRPSTPITATATILAHTEARKVFVVVAELLRLAAVQTSYPDRRELLWALLLNHVFVATHLSDGSPRWLRTVLFASVICGRLDSWPDPEWPPQDWPPVSLPPVQDGPAASRQKELRVVLRELIDAALSDEELMMLAFDHFPAVHDMFGQGMLRSSKTTTLVEYCLRRGKVPQLLSVIEGINPHQYERFRSQLGER